jgi:hypothetical protein
MQRTLGRSFWLPFKMQSRAGSIITLSSPDQLSTD